MKRIALIGHNLSMHLQLLQIEMDAGGIDQVDIIPIESAPKIPDETWLGHTFPIISSEPDPVSFEELYPLPKKGIGEQAKWANKPHKRKRKK